MSVVEHHPDQADAPATKPGPTYTAPARSVGRRVGQAGAGMAVLLAAVHAINDALVTIPSVLLPSLQQRFGLSEVALSALVALVWFSSSVTQPLFGGLADRFEPRSLAVGGVVISSALFSLIGVVPAAWMLFLVVLLAGLGSAALHPVGSSIARGQGGRQGDMAVSLFSAGGMLGFAIGPIVIIALVGAVGLGGTPWLMAPGLALAAILFVAIPTRRGAEGKAGSRRTRYVDLGLLRGPIGLLVVGGVLADMAFVTFTSAMPLWLVRERGAAVDAPLIAATLAAFSLAAAAGSVAAGWLSRRVPRRALVVGTMLGALVPLVLALHLPVGSVGFFVVVALGGALVYANFPLLILTAQDLAPGSIATASGMLMGLATGVAGMLYLGVGALQELVGLTTAITVAYLGLVPAAAVAHVVLSRAPRSPTAAAEIKP